MSLPAVQRRMESIARRCLDFGDIDEVIDLILKEKKLTDRQRLWITYKVAQMQAGRNIVNIALDGLRMMGDPYWGKVRLELPDAEV